MNPRCLITGCAVVNAHNGLWAVADLHEVAGAFVFVCNRDGAKGVDWHNGAVQHDKTAHLTGDWLERRGVIVVDVEDCELNETAKEYIREWTPGLHPDWGRSKS